MQTDRAIRPIVIDVTAISSIDSTWFSAPRNVRYELDAKVTEIWSVNPSVREQELLDEQAEVLDVNLLRRFQTHEQALAAFEQRDTSEPAATITDDHQREG